MNNIQELEISLECEDMKRGTNRVNSKYHISCRCKLSHRSAI